MAWSASDLDYKSLIDDAEASLSSGSAAVTTPAADETTTEAGLPFGASAFKGEGGEFINKLIDEGKSVSECREILKKKG